MIRMTSAGRLVPAGWTAWFLDVNPYWLALEPILSPGTYQYEEEWSFLMGSTGLAMAIAAVAAWRLTPETLAGFALFRRRSWLSRLPSGLSIASLDAWPAFWRECRSPHCSKWLRLLWGFYAVGALLFTVLAVVECATAGALRTVWPRPFNGFQAAVGLGLLSLLAPAALAEAPAGQSRRPALDPALNPLPGPEQVARVLPPRPMPGRLAGRRGRGPCLDAPSWSGVLMVAGLILAHGATVTSLGIALATWIRRIDRVLILSATASS